jgi:ribosomal protein S18 acetylase RimI-like enzyme
LAGGCRASRVPGADSPPAEQRRIVESSLSTCTVTLVIEPARDDADREACARMMSSSEPWITLNRSYERSLTIVSDPARELYVARRDGAVAGFILLTMKGQFPGYITTICVDALARGGGIGTQLVAFAEQRIHRESPNVFLCVSSFNTGAKRLYERLGFEFVGTLKDFIVAGHDELLYRKTIGPWSTFTPTS